MLLGITIAIVAFLAGYAMKAALCRQDYRDGWDVGYDCGYDDASPGDSHE